MFQESELQVISISENLDCIGHKDLLYPSFMSLILVTLPVLEQGEKLEHNQVGKSGSETYKRRESPTWRLEGGIGIFRRLMSLPDGKLLPECQSSLKMPLGTPKPRTSYISISQIMSHVSPVITQRGFYD